MVVVSIPIKFREIRKSDIFQTDMKNRIVIHEIFVRMMHTISVICSSVLSFCVKTTYIVPIWQALNRDNDGIEVSFANADALSADNAGHHLRADYQLSS